jgi:hypothetical protein
LRQVACVAHQLDQENLIFDDLVRVLWLVYAAFTQLVIIWKSNV